MATAESATAKRFRPKFHLRVLGTASPVFPGFEVDILDRVPDDEKPEAVWHRDRCRAILRAHPGSARAVWAHAEHGVLVLGGRRLAGWAVDVLRARAVVGSARSGVGFRRMLNVCMFQLAHECNHDLIFKKTFWNRVMFTITSLPMFLSAHHTWWAEHLTHHNDMGAKKDFITRRRTFFLSSRILSPMFFPYSLLMLVTQIGRSVVGLLMYFFTDLIAGGSSQAIGRWPCSPINIW